MFDAYRIHATLKAASKPTGKSNLKSTYYCLTITSKKRKQNLAVAEPN